MRRSASPTNGRESGREPRRSAKWRVATTGTRRMCTDMALASSAAVMCTCKMCGRGECWSVDTACHRVRTGENWTDSAASQPGTIDGSPPIMETWCPRLACSTDSDATCRSTPAQPSERMRCMIFTSVFDGRIRRDEGFPVRSGTHRPPPTTNAALPSVDIPG